MPSFVYILQSESTGGFYVGYTADLERRVAEHSEGRGRWTATRGPWRLRYREVYEDDSAARRRERALKRAKSRRYLEWVCRHGPGVEAR